MSFYMYDEALIERLQEITGDDRIHIVPPNNAIRFLAEFDKDKVNYPAIIVQRNSTSMATNQMNQYSILKGETVRINKEDNTATKIQVIPCRIDWSIDVYTVDRYTCDEIIRELVFYLMTHSRFQVKVPYDLDILQNFDIMVNPEIADNSDLVEFPNTGEFYRETMSVYTENAHLYSSHRQYLVDALPKVAMDKFGTSYHGFVSGKENFDDDQNKQLLKDKKDATIDPLDRA